MRHHNANRKFGRENDQRAQLLRSLARELFLHGKIITTDAKARELRPYAEKLITKARTGGMTAKRQIASRMANGAITRKIVDIIAPKFADRAGGYTRIIKLERRPSDGSKMAAIELVA